MDTERPEGIRISKFLSDNGICSRREAERMIEFGKVKMNGKRIRSPVCFITESDEILVNNVLVKRNK